MKARDMCSLTHPDLIGYWWYLHFYLNEVTFLQIQLPGSFASESLNDISKWPSNSWGREIVGYITHCFSSELLWQDRARTLTSDVKLWQVAVICWLRVFSVLLWCSICVSTIPMQELLLVICHWIKVEMNCVCNLIGLLLHRSWEK
jgi:hypothetical protein